MENEYFSVSEVPEQKGCRWFLKRGDYPVDFARGFRSKAEASQWIDEMGRRLDWRSGYTFRLRGDDCSMDIVDRRGVRAKP